MWLVKKRVSRGTVTVKDDLRLVLRVEYVHGIERNLTEK